MRELNGATFALLGLNPLQAVVFYTTEVMKVRNVAHCVSILATAFFLKWVIKSFQSSLHSFFSEITFFIFFPGMIPPQINLKRKNCSQPH